MLGSFLIFLREGIEGSMICAIVLAYLASCGRRDLFRWVFGGAAVAVLASGVVGAGLYAARAEFVGSEAQEWFETGTFAVAVVVLTYMTFWMKAHARKIAGELREKVDVAVTGGSGVALAIVAMATVGREALETAVFVVAITFQSQPVAVLGGAVVGLGASLALTYAIYKLGMRVNIGRLFTVVGAALMVVAAGLLANVVSNLQGLGVLPGGGLHIWDTGAVIPDQSTLGDILHGLLGYAASPTVLQVLIYLAFLAVGLVFFLRRPRATGRPQGA